MNLNNHRIIGITGKKFSGKDTLGSFFVDNHNYKRLAYADTLKDACQTIFNLTDEQLYGDQKETVDPFWQKKPREILQFVGTDLFRKHIHELMPDVGNNIWVKVVERKILDGIRENPDACFVITDVRFPNEAELVKNLGGIMIKVNRDSCNNSNDNHASETELDNIPYDYLIDNNGTKEELFRSLINSLGAHNCASDK